jgi:phosphate uptake regulator
VDIPRLALLAAAMVRKALQAFIEGDAEMATSVLMLDDQVDDMNRDAFRALGDLIKEKPELAPQALNALIISRNLERVGDHATNIAEDVIFWVRGALTCDTTACLTTATKSGRSRLTLRPGEILRASACSSAKVGLTDRCGI